MARLSVEHFRANSASTMTPDRSRKSTRLRDMFKSRVSISPPVPGEKRKDSADVSPLTSPALILPALKPGFEKIGLLPSERNSLADPKQDPDTADERKDVDHIDASTPEVADKHRPITTRKPSSGLEDAFREVYEKHQKELAEDEAKALRQGTNQTIERAMSDNTDGLYILRPSDDMSVPDSSKKHEIEDDGTSRYDSKRHSQTGFVGFSGFVDRDVTFVDVEPDVMPHDKRASFASNIFDNDDSLSQGIREYVETKIALSQVQLQRELHDKTQKTTDTIHITLELHMFGLNSIDSNSTRSAVDFGKLFRGRKSIGPYAFSNGIVAKTVQAAFIAMLCILALSALFKGLGAMLVLTFQGLCLLGVYVCACEACEWSVDTESDILLGPVSMGIKEAFALIGRTLRLLAGSTASPGVDTK